MIKKNQRTGTGKDFFNKKISFFRTEVIFPGLMILIFKGAWWGKFTLPLVKI